MRPPEKDLVLQRFIDFCRERDDWEVPPPPGLFDNLGPDDLEITGSTGDGWFDIGISGPGFRTDGTNMVYYKHNFGNTESNGWELSGDEITSDSELNIVTTPGVYKVSMPDYPPGVPRDDVFVVVYELDGNTPEEAIMAVVNEKFRYTLPAPSEVYEDMGIHAVAWDQHHPETYSVFGEIYAKDVDVLVEGFIDAPEV